MKFEVDSPQDIGRLARAARRAQGLRQDDLAAIVGASHVSLMNLERGNANVGLGRALDVLRERGVRVHLDVPPDVAGEVEKAMRGGHGQ